MDFDIYADLDFDLGKRYEELQKQSEELKEKIADLENKVSSLKDELIEVRGLNELLQLNISRLYNTAINELKRKNRELAETRTALDDFVLKHSTNETANKENREYNDLLREYKKKCEQLREKDKCIDDLKTKLAVELKKVEELRRSEVKPNTRKRSHDEDSNEDRSAKRIKANFREETSDYRNKGYVRDDRYFNNREQRWYEPQNFDSRHEQYFESRYRNNRRYITHDKSPNRDRSHFEHAPSRNKYYGDYSHRLKDYRDYRNYKSDVPGGKYAGEPHTPEYSYCEKRKPPVAEDTKTDSDSDAMKRLENKTDHCNEFKVKVTGSEREGYDTENNILKQDSQHEARQKSVEVEGNKFESESRPTAAVEGRLESVKKPIATDIKLGEDSQMKGKFGKKVVGATERKATAILPIQNINIYMKRMKERVINSQLVKQAVEENKNEKMVEKTDMNPNAENSNLTEAKVNVEDEPSVCETEPKKMKLDADGTNEVEKKSLDINKTKIASNKYFEATANNVANVSKSKLAKTSISEIEIKTNVEIPTKAEVKTDEIKSAEERAQSKETTGREEKTTKKLKKKSDNERTSTPEWEEVQMIMKNSLQNDAEKEKWGKKCEQFNSLSNCLPKNTSEIEKETTSEGNKLKERKKPIGVTISLKNRKVRTLSAEFEKQRDEKSAVKEMEMNSESKKLKVLATDGNKFDEKSSYSELGKSKIDNVDAAGNVPGINIEKQPVILLSDKEALKNPGKERRGSKNIAEIEATNVTVIPNAVKTEEQNKRPGIKTLAKNKQLKTINMEFVKQKTNTPDDEKPVKEQALNFETKKHNVQSTDTSKLDEKGMNFELKKRKTDDVKVTGTPSATNIEKQSMISSSEHEIVKNRGKEENSNLHIAETEATHIAIEKEAISDTGKTKEHKKLPGIKISLKNKTVKTINMEFEKQKINAPDDEKPVKEQERNFETQKQNVHSTDTNKSDKKDINCELKKIKTDVVVTETVSGINTEKQTVISSTEKEIGKYPGKEEKSNKNIAKNEATHIAVKEEAISDAVKTKEHKELSSIKISLQNKKPKAINTEFKRQKINTSSGEKPVKEQELNFETKKRKVQSTDTSKSDEKSTNFELKKRKTDDVEATEWETNIGKQSMISSSETEIVKNPGKEENGNKNIAQNEATHIAIEEETISDAVKTKEHKTMQGIKMSLKNKKVKTIEKEFEIEKTNIVTDEKSVVKEKELNSESKILKVQLTDTNKSDEKSINFGLEKNKIDNVEATETISGINISSSEKEIVINPGKKDKSNKNITEFEAMNISTEKETISEAVKSKEYKNLPCKKVSLKNKKLKAINREFETQKTNIPTDDNYVKEQDLNSETKKLKETRKSGENNINFECERNKIDNVEATKTDSSINIEEQSIILPPEIDVKNLVNEDQSSKNVIGFETTNITIEKEVSDLVEPKEYKKLPGIKISLKNKKVKIINMEFEKQKPNPQTDEKELHFETTKLKEKRTDTNMSDEKSITNELEKNKIDNSRTSSNINIENQPIVIISDHELIENSSKEENSKLSTSLTSAEKNVQEVAISESESSNVEQKKSGRTRKEVTVKHLRTRSRNKREEEISKVDNRGMRSAVLLTKMDSSPRSVNDKEIHVESMETVGNVPDSEMSIKKYEKSVEEHFEVTLTAEKETKTSDNQQQENENRCDMKFESAEAFINDNTNKQQENKYCETKLKVAEFILPDAKEKNESEIVEKDISKYDLAGLEKTRESIGSAKENVGTNAEERITEQNFCSLEEKLAQLHTSPKNKIHILKIEDIDESNRIDVRKIINELNRNTAKQSQRKVSKRGGIKWGGFLGKGTSIPADKIEDKKTSEAIPGRRSKERTVDGKSEAVPDEAVNKRTSGRETELCLVETDVAPENKTVEDNKEKKSKEPVTKKDEDKIDGNVNTVSESVQQSSTNLPELNIGSGASSSAVNPQPEKEANAAAVAANADPKGASTTVPKKSPARRRRCVITIK